MFFSLHYSRLLFCSINTYLPWACCCSSKCYSPDPTSSTPPHPPYPPAHLCIFLLERTHLPISYLVTLFGRKSETRSKKKV
ncbi:hypothetical protein HDK90DRAFT_215130 [Phyllosticta capitalensis]|uniref:Secreted protein n=1 Tax=Phyllosticta capitalensis TaxID=121624 RepID=A0ABR1YT52_9PEZI